jgi:dipeptidase D
LDEEYNIYKVTLSDFPGGHSGVDIDKNISSAIKVLVHELSQHTDIKLLHVEGGEMRNSIPKSASVLLAAKSQLDIKHESIKIEEVTQMKKECLKNSDKIIKVLNAFSQGVREFDKEFLIPSISANLGKIRQDENELRIDCSLRAMNDANLERLTCESVSLFELADFAVKTSDMHQAWTPNVGDFTRMVQSVMAKIYPDIELKAIHAGLECGVLMQTQKKPIEAVSIGPTIRFPHSLREECDMDSVMRIYAIVKDIIKKVQ